MAEAPASNLVTVFEDSRRWRNIVRRTDDIVISTPPKSGTTWMQGIVAWLLWPAGDAPATRGQLSPWVDARFEPIQDLSERLEQQTHRRFLKSHSPGDCLPFDPLCRYVLVYRHGLDALVSWGNHRATMHASVVEVLNAMAGADGVAPITPEWHGDYDALFEEWQQGASPTRHLASWWPRRHHDNVLFVHYNDLKADLDGEMRRIAAFLDIEVSTELWSRLVENCELDAMRAQAEAAGGLENVFKGGAASFYYRGVNGRWRELLTPAQIERYKQTVATELSDDAAAWLEHGSLALGTRPELVDGSKASVDDRTRAGTWHPVFSRLGTQRPANSIDAITQRRVDQAREQGLFDDLALHGKPIPDIDRPRPPGWWANQFVAKERNKVTAMQLEQELRTAMPALWRQPTPTELRAHVSDLNERIRRYNQATTLEPMALLDPDSVIETWQRLRDRA